MKLSNRHVVLLGVLSLASSATIGCKGAQTTLDVGVRVDTSTCKEDPNAPVQSDMVSLTCPTVSGGGTVHVVFPRKEWWGMKLRAAGVQTDVPGK